MEKKIAQKFNNDDAKYPQSSTLVKACFTLSHDNADVERDFSLSGDILDAENTQTAVELLNNFMTVDLTNLLFQENS